jgi:hypothetical protein
MCQGALGRPRPSQGHPRAWPVLVVLARCSSPPAHTPTARIEWPGLPFPILHMYVSSVSDVSDVCCNLFHLDVAKVDRGMLHMLHMLQVFQRHVVRICSKCFICFQTSVFHTYVATVSSKCFSYFSLMLQQVISCCKLQIWIFYVFHTYVASACYKCFVYFQTYVAFKCVSLCKCFMLYAARRGAGGRWCCGRGALGRARPQLLVLDS